MFEWNEMQIKMLHSNLFLAFCIKLEKKKKTKRKNDECKLYTNTEKKDRSIYFSSVGNIRCTGTV